MCDCCKLIALSFFDILCAILQDFKTYFIQYFSYICKCHAIEMRSNSARNMYMYNNPPWDVHQGNGHMFPMGQPRHPMPYHMVPPPPYQPGPSWQGPGPSRPRGRGHRRGRGSRYNSGNRGDGERANEPVKDVCCKCGERLQNCDEPGIHMCDGGNTVIINERQIEKKEKEEELEKAHEEEFDARLEKLLENLKDFVRSKYKSVTEALEGYVSDKIDEISTLHRENAEEKAALEKLKKELEDKAHALVKQEKDIKDKLKRLAKDQDAFKREAKKEREEVCRQWQQLRDEITRMEEMHEIQKGRVKLDVGGHVYTTSLLTLTRNSDSMLAAMFSGRHEILKEEDGCVFIDRDGTHFRHVLNYLRDGGVSMECLPRDRQLLRELKKEATYYQLHGLLQQIEKCLY